MNECHYCDSPATWGNYCKLHFVKIWTGYHSIAWNDKLKKLKRISMLQKLFEIQYDQSYVKVEFATSEWTWGYIRFRASMSGAGLEQEFNTLDEAIEFLEKLVKRDEYLR